MEPIEKQATKVPVPFTGPAMNNVRKGTLDEFNITTHDLSKARADHKYNYIITNKILSGQGTPSNKKLLKAKIIVKETL